MGFPSITIKQTDGNLHRLISTSDVGAIVASDKTGLEPVAVYTIEEAQTLLKDKPILLQMATEFYGEVGGKCKLWVFSPGTGKKVNEIAEASDATGLKYLMKKSGYEITLIALACVDTVGTELLTEETKTAALGSMKTFCEAMSARNTPVRVLIGGKVADKTKAMEFKPREVENPYCAIVFGCTKFNTQGACAAVLGRAVKYAVHEKVGSGKNGALSLSTLYIGDAYFDERSDIEDLHDKGLMTFHRRAGVSGYFVGVDNMLTTGDFRYLAHGRIMDKAQRLVAAAGTPYLETPVRMLASGGIDESDAAAMEIIFESTIRGNMGEMISDVSVKISASQDLINTSNLAVEIKVLPLGYMTWITVTMGLASNLQS